MSEFPFRLIVEFGCEEYPEEIVRRLGESGSYAVSLTITFAETETNGARGYGDFYPGPLLKHRVSGHRPKPGFVYFIKSDHGIKIGRAKNWKSRTRTIISSLPFPAEVLKTIETSDMVKLERQFHERFADFRLNGEWFDVTQEQILASVASEVAWLNIQSDDYFS